MATVEDLYRQILGRPSDPGGLAYYQDLFGPTIEPEEVNTFLANIAPGAETITQEQQQAYMSKYNDCFYICLYNGEPAGYIGVIDDDIRVATHPDYQGKGIASFMVTEIKKIQPSSVAKIKIDNEASLALFKGCGFKIKYYLLEQQ